ncbi:hypothetical protein J2X36_003957 [Methylobacterium sp. BE186]|uniref:hypothetical protein n=1 Tax=Methylobacterium sp. BE186 TaxID=2817715 RepID=UPI00286270B4|nr:hypothetical protein [Methylobacterium sp. BE186]MDR7039184.1 hypothetical protein [Methylobacterium sp. BE186]
MRHIHVEAGLRLRFPGRDEAFNEGVEIGLALARMAAGQREFTLRCAATTLNQAHVMAARMGYRVHVVQVNETSAEVTFLTGSRRPKLTLIPGLDRISQAG